MEKHISYILAGGNIPVREDYIAEAALILQNSGIKILHCSSIYESTPWGFTAEQNFLNQVFKLSTSLSPEELLNVLLNTEQKLGRKRTNKNGYHSRVIDLDILFYNDQIVESKNLTIPHPRIAERRFTLEPLNELIPEFVHPVIGLSIHTLLNKCQDQGKVTIYNPDKNE